VTDRLILSVSRQSLCVVGVGRSILIDACYCGLCELWGVVGCAVIGCDAKQSYSFETVGCLCRAYLRTIRTIDISDCDRGLLLQQSTVATAKSLLETVDLAASV
jgi:hypothetical protein